MSAPAQINTLRATDFPNGLATKADVDKFFQFLNPFFAALATAAAHGTSLGDNLDVQIASFSFTAATTFSPLVVRLKDGKRPRLLLCSALNTKTNATEQTWNPAWTYLGQSPGGNQVRVDGLSGIAAGSPYTVTVFVFF